jgi:hypothetical protein
MIALPQDQVLTPSLLDRHYVFLGKRLDSIHLPGSLPGPERLNRPQLANRPRGYTDRQKPAVTAETGSSGSFGLFTK